MNFGRLLLSDPDVRYDAIERRGLVDRRRCRRRGEDPKADIPARISAFQLRPFVQLSGERVRLRDAEDGTSLRILSLAAPAALAARPEPPIDETAASRLGQPWRRRNALDRRKAGIHLDPNGSRHTLKA